MGEFFYRGGAEVAEEGSQFSSNFFPLRLLAYLQVVFMLRKNHICYFTNDPITVCWICFHTYYQSCSSPQLTCSFMLHYLKLIEINMA